MPSPRIRIADGVEAGGGAPLLLIAGPDSIESEAHALRMARALREIARERGVPLVYKSSFDKANRTSAGSFRGPGLAEGLRILARVKEATGLPVTTDFHTPDQAALLAPVVDLLQVPAMLSRQTDMLLAAAASGRAVNVKKGQFLAPWDAARIVEKLRGAGCETPMVTERGATFTQCVTGLEMPIVSNEPLKELRRLHRSLNPAHKVARTAVDAHIVAVAVGAATKEQLVIDKVIEIKPGTGC